MKDETKIKLEKSFNNGICQIRRSSCTRKFVLPNEWPCQFTQNECNVLVKYLPTILVRIRVMSFVCSTTEFIPDRYYCTETIFFYMVTKFGVWLLCVRQIFSDRFCGKKFQMIEQKYVPFRINSQYHSVEISVSRDYPFAIHSRLLETVIQICFDVVIVNKSTWSSCSVPPTSWILRIAVWN